MTNSRTLFNNARLRDSAQIILPEGANENSPGWSAAEPWECAAVGHEESRWDDRNLSPHIARVVFDAMLFQNCYKLRLEIAFPMMFSLALDVSDRRTQLRPTDRKRAVTLLPIEVSHRASFVHPTRGCALDLLHCLRYRERRRKRQHEVNVIVRSTDYKSLHLMPSCDSAHVGPQSRLDIQRNGLASLLRREDAMEKRAPIGV